MSPVTVFFRTLLKSSAIFIGTATIFLNPALECRSTTHAGVGAQQAGSEAAVDGLIALLKDTNAGVRRAAGNALAELDSRRAVPGALPGVIDGDPQHRAVIV